MIDGGTYSRRSLFRDKAGEDTVHAWIIDRSPGIEIQTHQWGAGIEQHHGSDTIETWLRLDGATTTALARSLADADPTLDRTRRRSRSSLRRSPATPPPTRR